MYIALILLMLVLGTGIGVYGYYFVRRIFNVFKLPKNKGVKIVNIVLAVIIGLLCVNIFSFSAIIVLHIIVISLIVDLINFIIKKILKEKYDTSKAIKWVKTIIGVQLIPIVAACAIMIYGYYNMNHIVETDYSLTTDKSISIEEDGQYRIALIADLHYSVSIDDEELMRVCKEISEKNPDIVALCGDIVDENTSKEKMKFAFKALSTINSKYGIFFVYGNHDRQLYSNNKAFTEEELAQYIESCGITILQDQVYSVNDEFTIIGREDRSYSDSKNVPERKSLSELMEGVNKDSFILVMDHQPKEYAENEKNGIDLLISGHTHGGQIWPANVLFNIAKFDDAVYGETVGADGKFKAFVTSGIAGWGYPVKTAAPAEYVIINIDKK